VWLKTPYLVFMPWLQIMPFLQNRLTSRLCNLLYLTVLQMVKSSNNLKFMKNHAERKGCDVFKTVSIQNTSTLFKFWEVDNTNTHVDLGPQREEFLLFSYLKHCWHKNVSLFISISYSIQTSRPMPSRYPHNTWDTFLFEQTNFFKKKTPVYFIFE
jgi:hypothetical protein